MTAFSKKLMETNTAEEYDALLHTRFPRINEAFHGYESMPVAQLRVKIDSLFKNAMGLDWSKYPWRYEACMAPGSFLTRIGEDSQNIRYTIGTAHEYVTDFIIHPSQDELESQTIPAADQISKDTMQAAMDTVQSFAKHLYYPIGQESVITPSKEPLTKGQTAGKTPVPFNLLIPRYGIGYEITVDIDTMRVVRAAPGYMETDKDGNVVPLADTARVTEEMDP